MAQICYGCFKTIQKDDNVCPYCGYRIQETPDALHILKPGTILNQKYTIGKTLGEGGFGITYLAWDNNMQIKIAIKEFYPASLVARDTSSAEQTQIYTITQSGSGEFHQGLERFVREASTLAQFFKLPGIVSVKDFFYENRTAYIVMEYIEGITLKEYLKQRGGVISVEETLTLMKPVIESLAVIHGHKLLHRDISPDNLMITQDFQVKLIDFGSARYFDSQSDKSMTVVLKHGYAPIEQYSSNGNQGTWTDIYSLCATMYRMLTGRVPDEAINRIRSDALAPVRSVTKKLPGNVAQAIDKGLSVMAENRQQTLEELYRELYMSRQDFRATKRSRIYQGINKFLIRLIVGIVVCLAILCIVWMKRNAISDTVSQVAEKFVIDEDKDSGIVQRNENGGKTKGSEDSASEDDISSRQEEGAESDADEEVKTADDHEEDAPETGKDDTTQDTLPGAETVPEDTEPEMTKAQRTDQSQDAGSQKYQMMRSGAQSALDTDASVVRVKNGKLNNIASGYTVGEILDLYSDQEGQWYTYEDAASSKRYVYYEGSKGDSSFVLEFEVYENNTFKLTGAMQNDQSVEQYSDFFQSILDSLGF